MPVVSCVMVTAGGPDRFPRLTRSVMAYCRQSYPDRELVIVTDELADADFATLSAFVRSLDRDDIRLVRPDRKLSLGALRNASVDAARGEVVCQWDDDDLFHPERLALQMKALRRPGIGAVFLRDIMHLLEAHRVMYWVRWDAADMPCHPATLMAFRALMPRYPEVGPDSRRNEDRCVYMELRARTAVSFIEDYPFLYGYVFHGTNTFQLQHHLRPLSYAMPARAIRRRRRELLGQLAKLDFDRNGVELMSHSGPVLTLG